MVINYILWKNHVTLWQFEKLSDGSTEKHEMLCFITDCIETLMLFWPTYIFLSCNLLALRKITSLVDNEAAMELVSQKTAF